MRISRPAPAQTAATARYRRKGRDTNSDVVQTFGQVSSGGNRDALRRMEGRQASGRSPVDPPEPAVDSRHRKLDFVGGVSAVGSASRAGSSHRRSRAAGEVELSEPPTSDALPASAPASLVDASRPRAFARSRMAPSVRRRRSSPQPQEGADALAPPPNELSPNNRFDDMPFTSCERIWGGMKARISVVHRRVGPRSGYAIQTRPQGASGGEGGALACTYRIFVGNRG
jgi:hypothetical protein